MDDFTLPSMNSDLSLVPIETLRDEIIRRSKTAVVLISLDDADNDDGDLLWGSTGRRSVMLGMMEMMKHRTLREVE